jgi:hypothetical protein
MRSETRILAIGCALFAVAVGAYGAVVTYDIVPPDNPGAHEITIAPGATVNVVLTARVDPSDPANPDTDGLALVNVDIVTDLGTPLTSVTPDPGFAAIFSILTSGGKPQGNRISEIGGAQNTFNASAVHRNIGLGTATTVATGSFQAPTTEGTYTIGTAGNTTNVLAIGTAQSVFPVNDIVNNTLSVQVSSSPTPQPAPSPSPFSLCGAGIAESALLCALGLFAVRRAPRGG